MSEKIIGLIEEKTMTESPAGSEKEWKRIAFKVNGKTFSTFDTDNDSFKKGENVEIEYTDTTVGTKTFHNIVSMKKTDGEVPVVKPGGPVMKTADKYVVGADDKELAKNASVLISYVKDMICAGKIEPSTLKSNVAVLVDVFKETKKQLSE